ncbi:hybrid sensor histidine kinase/response regulator [Nisaea sediminum]|uniref:hybrid sensor histidine kinase/response regulator n=1 Tax=Nisaea sediminum TaxID=2775867 RepID=UPI001865FAFD|nr:PAS domain-containing sensor histidine kinase [Nisaea sediminum]
MGSKIGIVGKIVLTLIAVACFSSGSSIYLLYRSHLERQRVDLEELVDVASSLIASVAAFDQENSADDHPDGALGATLEQIRIAFDTAHSFGTAGGLIIFRETDEGRFEVLIHRGDQNPNPHDRNDIERYTAYGTAIAEGFDGTHGSANFTDASGVDFLIAYEPVRGTDLLVLAEVRKSEFEAPFLNAIAIAVMIASAIGTVGVIFAHREAESIVAALQEERQKFQDFASSASDWFWVQDENLRYTSVGESKRPHPEIDASQVLGKRREDSADEDTSTEKWTRLNGILQNREPFKDFVYKAISEEGKHIILSASGVPYFDNSGRFRGYRGSASDVTEHLHREQLLSETRERAHIAFQNMTVGIVEITSTGVIETFNPKAEEIFGYRADEVVGRNVSMLMPKSIAREHDRYLERFLKTGEHQIIGIGRELNGLTKNGKEVPIHLGVAETRLGRERHFIAAITDLRKQKSLETMLRRSNKLDAIGQLSGGIAHDFNNLLGIILGNLELMQRKLEPESKLYRQVGKAIAAAQRGAGLTRKLLDFSRQSPDAQRADIVDTIEVVSGLSDLIERSLTASISFVTRFEGDIPRVKCDKSDFEDSIINLIVNARDAMPGGGRIEVAVSPYTVGSADVLVQLGLAPGTYAQIEVSDNGSGMSKEIVDKIFDPFFTTKPVTKGTGLGLPMVYGFVKRSGGHVIVYSEEGTGTIFKLYLPSVSDDAEIDRSRSRTADDEPVRGGSETILVVDDEPGLLDVAERVLEDLGYKVVTAQSAEAALQILSEGRTVDLLFTDLIMPGGVNGIQLIESAQLMRPRLKSLLTSGFTGHHLKSEEAEHWAKSLVAKPYSNDGLARAVRAKLDEERTA